MAAVTVLLLGVVFVLAGASKLSSPDAFRATLRKLMPPPLAVFATRAIPLIELLLGLLLLIGIAPRILTAFAIIVLLVFSAALLRMWRRGVKGCGCFGEASESAPSGLARNAILIATAVYFVVMPTDVPRVWPGGFSVVVGQLTVVLARLRLASGGRNGEASQHDFQQWRALMNAVWIVSMVLQWVVIALLCLLVLSLIRQLGALNIRINALKESGDAEGPALQTKLAAHELTLADGSTRTIGGTRKQASLVVFFSPSCGACEALPEAINHLANEQSRDDLDVLAVISSDRTAAFEFARAKSIDGVPVAASEDFPEYYIPRHGVPYAVALTPDGVIAARGKPKTLEHLREMAHAARHMAELATTHSVREHEWGQSAPYWEAGQR